MRPRPPSRAVTAALLASLVLLTLFAACGGGGGASHTDRLIIVRNEGLFELSLADGSEQVLVANLPDSVLIEPALSPSRDRLAYVRQLTPIIIPGQPFELGMDLYLAGVGGSDPVMLLEHSQRNEAIRSPSWFPDGERLLINVQNLGGAQIVTTIETLDLQTGTRTPVVGDGFLPSVSPDGAQIVFLRSDAQLNQSLWIANADGSGARLLAGPDDGLGSISSPRFSPDSRFVAFGAAELQGGGSIRAPGPAGVALAGRAANAAARHANGLPQDIWLYDLEAGELRLLAAVQLDQPSIAWSGDGGTIFAFGGAGLFAIDPKGGSSRRLGEGTFHGQMDWVSAE